MMECGQAPGQNVLQHGRSVREHYFALVDHLNGRVDLTEALNWRLPAWVDAHRDQLLAALPPRYVMDRYLTLHDGGKPAVREVDETGRQHFPGHADASAAAYADAFADEADPDVSWLIAHDMDVHTMSAADVPTFASNPFAVAQLLAGLAETVSNAALFGGVESTGFKMKFKRLDQRGRAVTRELFE